MFPFHYLGREGIDPTHVAIWHHSLRQLCRQLHQAFRGWVHGAAFFC